MGHSWRFPEVRLEVVRVFGVTAHSSRWGCDEWGTVGDFLRCGRRLFGYSVWPPTHRAEAAMNGAQLEIS